MRRSDKRNLKTVKDKLKEGKALCCSMRC